HADIRGLVTTVLVSVAAPASLYGRGSWPRNTDEDCADTGAASPLMARDREQRVCAPCYSIFGAPLGQGASGTVRAIAQAKAAIIAVIPSSLRSPRARRPCRATAAPLPAP